MSRDSRKRQSSVPLLGPRPDHDRVMSKSASTLRCKGQVSEGDRTKGIIDHLDIADILDALPMYALLISSDHRILQANSAVATQFGLEPEAIVGGYCPKEIHGLDEPWHACPLEEASQKGAAVERQALDETSGRWIRSAVYPTGRRTPDGKVIFLHIVTDVTGQKQAEDQLKESREQLRKLSEHLESAREAERTKLAREVHDELGQILTALKIDVAWLSSRVAAHQTLVMDKLVSVNDLLDTALRSVKRISTDLRPSVLDDLGLAAAIEWQGQEFQDRTDIRFDFASRPRDIILDRDRSTALFRILQEALTNVARHANATKVRVRLRMNGRGLVLEIADDGRGITENELTSSASFGLIGMGERARSLGGSMLVHGVAGKGTSVVATIPLRDPGHSHDQSADSG